MRYINVRTKPGRVARIAPKGRFIPHDTPTSVALTPYINRLLNHHGDIEVVKLEKPAKDEPAPSPKPAADADKGTSAKAKGSTKD